MNCPQRQQKSNYTVKYVSSSDRNVCFMTSKHHSKNCWSVDSAATCHMNCSEEFFSKLTRIIQMIFFLNITSLKSRGLFEVEVLCGDGKILLYMPHLYGNLILVPKITMEGFVVNFQENKCVTSLKGVKQATAFLENKLHILKIKTKQ